MPTTAPTCNPTPAAMRRLAPRPCPACGCASAAALATLPSGRQALVEACPICGRQTAALLPVGQVGQPPAGEPPHRSAVEA